MRDTSRRDPGNPDSQMSILGPLRLLDWPLKQQCSFATHCIEQTYDFDIPLTYRHQTSVEMLVHILNTD